MADHEHRHLEGPDEEIPLITGDTPISQKSNVAGSRSRSRRLIDLHLLSFSFLLVFLAYSATQNLESSVNADGNLGSVSLGILYLSLTICSIGAPLPVRWLGPKRGILLGLSGYWLFILANLFPSWFTMIPASLYLGFTASLLWVAEGTYITSAAKSYALEIKIAEEDSIGNFNGVFWSYFASNQIIGNLLSLIILQSGKVDSSSYAESSVTTWPLLLTFLGCMLGGTIVAWFLSSQEDIAEQTKSNGSEFMFSTFSMLTEKKILLLLPLLVYSGLQQAFIWGDFTENIVTPVLGVSLIGGVMAAYGAADAGGSLLAGRLSSGLASMSNIIYFGGISQLIVLVWIFLMKSYGSIMSGYLNIFGQAIIWGFGDASFNTQISSLLGTLFPGQTEGAFAQWKIWQSAATSLIFFITSSTTLSARIVLLLFMLPISLLAFSALRFMIIRKELIQNDSVTCQS